MQERLIRLRTVAWCLLASIVAYAAIIGGIVISTGSSLIPVTASAATLSYQAPVSINAPRLTLVRWGAAVRVVAARPSTYMVRPGDTLSLIAKNKYQNAKAWPAIYWANNHKIKYADLIFPGQQLTIPAKPSHIPAAPSKTTPTVTRPVVTQSANLGEDSDAAPSTSHQNSAPAPTPATGGNGYAVTSSFQACVIQRESGGNPQIWNASGHWGLYQFSYSTWVGHGGSAALFGHAGGAYQTIIFWNTVRQDGTSDWAPYDGCSGPAGSPATTAALIQPSPKPPVSAPLTTTDARALAWALTQKGKWYQWAGSGPSVYDCSGLVMVAYRHVGIYLPHNADAILYSGHLRRTYSPRPGDLVMWGGSSPYHVEFWVSPGRTFGAHHTGTQIGYASLWGSPAYYSVS